MKISQAKETLNISNIKALAASNASLFHSAVRAALTGRLQRIDIDLSETDFMDCGGMGALIAVRNSARRRNASAVVRLLNPGLSARSLLQLPGMESFFSI